MTDEPNLPPLPPVRRQDFENAFLLCVRGRCTSDHDDLRRRERALGDTDRFCQIDGEDPLAG